MTPRRISNIAHALRLTEEYGAGTALVRRYLEEHGPSTTRQIGSAVVYKIPPERVLRSYQVQRRVDRERNTKARRGRGVPKGVPIGPRPTTLANQVLAATTHYVGKLLRTMRLSGEVVSQLRGSRRAGAIWSLAVPRRASVRRKRSA